MADREPRQKGTQWEIGHKEKNGTMGTQGTMEVSCYHEYHES